jgi:hypothetical protein
MVPLGSTPASNVARTRPSFGKLAKKEHALRTAADLSVRAGQCQPLTSHPLCFNAVVERETAQESQHRLLVSKQQAEQHRAAFHLRRVLDAQQALVSVMQDFVSLDLAAVGRVKNGELESSLRQMVENQEMLSIAALGVVYVYDKQRAEGEDEERRHKRHRASEKEQTDGKEEEETIEQEG